MPDEVGDHLYAISRTVLKLFNFVLGVREMEEFEGWLDEAFAEIARLVDERRRMPRERYDPADATGRRRGRDRRPLAAFAHPVPGAGRRRDNLAFLASAIRQSLDMPEIRPAIADPARRAAVVEELLRLDSPVILAARRPTRDIEVGGRRRPAPGSFRTSSPATAIPRPIPEPDRFQPGREGPGNLAFGEGAHGCLGAALARLEGRIVLPTFARSRRRRRAEATDEWVRLDTFRRLARLPITLD